MDIDPREMVSRARMSPFQKRVVAVMIGLNALDGFDVLSISFASPGIASAWSVERAALGVVLSMELIGMALGALVLGAVADRIGRRRTILTCLFIMAGGMALAAASGDIVQLTACRLLTGIGIGGMLAATNAAVAEVASAERRSLCVVLMAAGYPVGTVVGGMIATMLLRHFAWPAIFVFGTLATAAFIPVVLRQVPESIDFLVSRGGGQALRDVNAILRRMRRPAIDHLPAPSSHEAAIPLFALFGRGVGTATVLLTIAYLGQIMTFYFILKWIPKIVADMGYAPDRAGLVLVWASVGGVTGAVVLGLTSIRLRVLALTLVAAGLSALLVTLFGRGQSTLTSLSLMAALAGTATNAGVVGLYALVAERFPTSLRATATGFVIGVGRGGSALAPAVAGLLFSLGYRLPAVAAIMSTGSVVAFVALGALALLRPAPSVANHTFV